MAFQEKLSRDQMEIRRILAAEDFQEGFTQAEVVRRHQVSRTTVSRWYRSWINFGIQSLCKRRATGRPPRLSAEQRRELEEMYKSGPRRAGFSADRWTTRLLTKAIAIRFGVSFHPDHVGRIIIRLKLREARHYHRHTSAAAD